MRGRWTVLFVSSLVVASLLVGTASGDPDHDSRADGGVDGPNVAAEIRRSSHPAHPKPSHLTEARRRPAVEENFELVGHVTVPGEQAAADVYFFDHGDAAKFVYLGSYREPCTSDGVTIVDVSDPSQPEVAAVAPLPERYRTSTEDVVVEAIGDRVILVAGLQACGRRVTVRRRVDRGHRRADCAHDGASGTAARRGSGRRAKHGSRIPGRSISHGHARNRSL